MIARGDVGMSGAVRGTAGYRKDSSTDVGIDDSLFCYHTECKHQASRAACSMRVDCAKIFRMGGQGQLVIRQEISRTRYGIPSTDRLLVCGQYYAKSANCPTKILLIPRLPLLGQ